MSDSPARLLRAAVTAAERAAVARQYTCRRSGSAATGVISDLHCAYGSLDRARIAVDDGSGLNRTMLSWVVFTQLCVAAVVTVSVVLLPHPADPRALAGVLVAAYLFADVAQVPFWWIVHRRSARAAAAANPVGTAAAVADLRRRIAEIRPLLEPARSARDMAAGRELERALYWLDAAESDLAREPRETLSYRYQMTTARPRQAS